MSVRRRRRPPHPGLMTDAESAIVEELRGIAAQLSAMNARLERVESLGEQAHDHVRAAAAAAGPLLAKFERSKLARLLT